MTPPKPQPFLDEPVSLSQEPESELNLGEYIRMVRRHWAGGGLTARRLVIAGIHYFITPKEYLSTATIQIERRNLSPVGGSASPWFENFWNLSSIRPSTSAAEPRPRRAGGQEPGPDERPAFNPRRGCRQGADRGDHRRGGAEATLGRLALQIEGGLAVEPVRGTQLVRLSFRLVPRVRGAGGERLFRGVPSSMGVEDRHLGRQGFHLLQLCRSRSLKQEVVDKEIPAPGIQPQQYIAPSIRNRTSSCSAWESAQLGADGRQEAPASRRRPAITR